MRVFVLCLLLTACATQQPPAWQPRKAAHARCNAQCTTPCAPDVWPQWEGDPDAPKTWDALAPVASENKETAERCDAGRDACVRCLRALERAGVICGVDVRC